MICLFGGTFDPVHNGHLHAARVASERLECPVRLVLSARPPHRAPPLAGIAERWAMLQAACANLSGLVADDMEIHRRGHSYTVDTLQLARRHLPDVPLFWAVGVDAFSDIFTWHRWQEVFGLAHLLLLDRPGSEIDAPARGIYEKYRLHGVPSSPCGGILRVEDRMLQVSGSAIRAAVAAGRPFAHLLPAGVAAYIRRHGLYAGENATAHRDGGSSERGDA